MKSNYKNIKTHNLKGIDFSFDENELIVVRGASGSGKSSLAFDTVFQISNNELRRINGKKETYAEYLLDSYNNIISAASLTQDNYNTNPYSTVGTYFDLQTLFCDFLVLKKQLSRSDFQLRYSRNLCNKCSGLGYIYSPDIRKIICPTNKLSAQTFKIWRSYMPDFHRQIFELFCNDEGINLNLKFNELNKFERNHLLNSISSQKYKIKYKEGSSVHTKTSYYYGPLAELREEIESNKIRHFQYLKKEICPECHGARFANRIVKLKIDNLDFGTIYCLPFEQLEKWLLTHEDLFNFNTSLLSNYNNLLSFLSYACYLKLGHLNLSRSIPSLSGGELQRLRLCRALCSSFKGLLYVLDEPSAGLHPSEIEIVSQLISKLKKTGTVIVVEQGDYLDKIATNVLYLGPSGGSQGGFLCNQLEENKAIKKRIFKSNNSIVLENIHVNNVNIDNITIKTKSLIGICGVSGSGKSSFAKEILQYAFDHSVYLKQESIRGNSYSSVGSYLGLQNLIAEYFAEKLKKSKNIFSLTSRNKYICQKCKGTGFISTKADEIKLVCSDCNGKRYSDKILKMTVNSLSIADVYSLTVDELASFIPKENKKIHKIIETCQKCGLGYLVLNQKIETLSGGECQRLKLISTIHSKEKTDVFILDEPCKGLDIKNIYNVISLIYSLIENDKTVYMIEHNPIAISLCSYVLEFGPEGGINGGKIIFNSDIDSFIQSKSSFFSKYIK